MALEFGTLKTQNIIEYQIGKLDTFGFMVKSFTNMETHVYVQVTSGSWQFGQSVIHDGTVDDIQRATHEAHYACLNAAWTFHRERLIKYESDLDYMINFGILDEPVWAKKKKEELLSGVYPNG